MQLILSFLGGYAAENRGVDFVKYLAPALRARTRYLTGHREPHNQATLACTAPGAGQHRDYVSKIIRRQCDKEGYFFYFFKSDGNIFVCSSNYIAPGFRYVHNVIKQFCGRGRKYTGNVHRDITSKLSVNSTMFFSPYF